MIIELLTILCLALVIIPILMVIVGGPILLVKWTYEYLRDGEYGFALAFGGLGSFAIGLIGLFILSAIGAT